LYNKNKNSNKIIIRMIVVFIHYFYLKVTKVIFYYTEIWKKKKRFNLNIKFEKSYEKRGESSL
jgi:hypothetical protein